MIKKIVAILSLGVMVATTSMDVYAQNNLQKKQIDESKMKISMELNKSYFKKAKEAILINEDAGVDAVAVTPYAYQKNAPIITTTWKNLKKETINYIKELGVEKITIIGGLKNVSQTTENKLIDMGIKVNRIYGKDRFKTSTYINEDMEKERKSDAIIVISSTCGLENAIAIEYFACKNNLSIIWGKDDQLEKTIKYVNRRSYKKVYAMGDSERFTHDMKKGVKNVVLIEEMNEFDTNLDSIEKLYTKKEQQDIYVINTDYGNYADISNFVSLPLVAAKQNRPILVCKENITYAQDKFIQKNVKEIIEVGEETGEYSIINTLTKQTFISAVVLISLLIILTIRAFKA